MNSEFMKRLTDIVEANLADENFGVEDLVREMGISHINLHRKLKTISNQTISQFIREIRLKKARELLLNEDLTASEISYRVGFGSPTYFNHCFHEYFGLPPGEVKRILLSENGGIVETAEKVGIEPEPLLNDLKHGFASGNKQNRKKIILLSAFAAVLFALAWILYSFLANGKDPLDIFHRNKKELSIIVLPFKNLSDDRNNQYFADGIAEDILDHLFRITALRVVSRTSAEQFRESSFSVREIARKVHVNYVLEGSVRHYGNKTRISVQLIDAYHDEHLWSSNFDRELNDIIGVQGEIALKVANKLNTVLSANEIRQIEKISTQNPEAYDFYLRARFLLHKANSEQRSDFDKESVMSRLQYYEKAIAADTTFAEAYAGLSNAWFNLSAWGFLPMNEGFPKARNLSMKALEIDPDCAEAHAVIGAYHVWVERKFEEGHKELLTSIHLDPNFSTARQWYAQLLMITGPIEEARVHIERALELEPYFGVVQNLSAWIYYFEEKYDKAIETCIVARDLKPDFIDNQWLFFLNYAKLGEGEKAVQMLQTIRKHYPGAEQYDLGLRKHIINRELMVFLIG